MDLKKRVHCTTWLFWYFRVGLQTNAAVAAFHLHGWWPKKAAIAQYFMTFKNKVLQQKRKGGERRKPCCSVRRKFPLYLMRFLRTMQAGAAVTRAVLMVLEDSPPHLVWILSSRSFAWQCLNFSNSIKLEPGISPPLTSPQFSVCASNYHFFKRHREARKDLL